MYCELFYAIFSPANDLDIDDGREEEQGQEEEGEVQGGLGEGEQLWLTAYRLEGNVVPTQLLFNTSARDNLGVG